MNKLEKRIKNDITLAMKGDRNVLNTLRMVISEIPRLNLKANISATDDQITKIIKKLVKSETETLKLKGLTIENSLYINVLSDYLPTMVTEIEIIEYIKKYIDFTKLKNKMQAIGLVNKHFGDSVDGKTVANIVKTMF